MNDFQWERFTETRQRFDDHITITKSGGMGFPKKFSQDNHVNDYKYVLLFFDPTNHAIGISFTNDDTEKGKLSLAKSNQGFGANVNARTFFLAKKIDFLSHARKYDWKKESFEGKDLFVIVLDQPESPAGHQEDKKTESDASQEAGASTTPGI
ncbi:MAG: hypothetical protein AAB542_03330 [Patescibacteria group bacterium]